MNKETKMKESYKLLNKLLRTNLDDIKLETNESILTTTIEPSRNLCEAEMCLCIAIAKRTNTSWYRKADGALVFYISTDKYNTAHYLRWADKHIKRTIELEVKE